MPEDQAGPGFFGDAEQIEFAPQLAMIALLRFLDLGQIGVQLRLGQKGRSINSLQPLPMLIAPPVGAGEAEEAEGRRIDRSGVDDMGTGAEIDKVSQAVAGESFTGLLLDQLHLEMFAASREIVDRFIFADQAMARISVSVPASSCIFCSIFLRSSSTKLSARSKS